MTNNTGVHEFDNTIQKTNQILKEIESAFGWGIDQRNQSYAALRAVLHTLRDRLPVIEAVQMADQLPMLIRGMYFDGWNPARVPVKMNKEEFLQEIRRQFPFSIEGDITKVVRVVLKALRKHISWGEAEDIISSLPKGIDQIVNQYI